MTVPAAILALIERFQEHSDDYRSSTYNETQLRREFLDPFFTALGWDMDNRAGAGQAMREVLHEYSIKIDGQSKAPDYCFRSGATEKFFVEAKKPAVNLKEDWKPAFQTRTYGWQQNLPFCVLTDFEEFAVYDCRFKPETRDTAQTARIFYCKYADYPQQWSQIESWFGREAVLAGSLEQQAASSSKKGALPFDVDFLNLISSWRERLANNIAERNRALQLTQTDLNYAVQMTIDRILFLRMCEDRGLEPFDQLQTLRAGKNIYGELLDLFRQADNRYNSGLFHFGAEKARGGFADQLTPQLTIDDYVLADIIYKLYLPSPYNFRTMSVEILGQVYEQFLGKVIRLDGNKTSVEEKPEVRKAGGVYYTPSYIVNYIVAQTVGKLCAGKTPVQVAKIKVLDPACGSGSFLIGAYNYLLQWHLEFYLGDDPEKHANKRQPTLYRVATDAENGAAATQWRLTASEKKRILLANIYGVDIDRQAVEVTKLSLLLKMLEDTADVAPPTPDKRLIPSQQRLLPDLEANIKCGNSLIGHDFFASDTDYSDAERERINAFDWDIEFAEIMQSGGFDTVIGNPPYIGFHGFSEDKSYLTSTYLSAQGKFDYYLPFIENGLILLKENGVLSYICPTNFTKRGHGEALRVHLQNSTTIEQIVDFQDVQIFSGALNYVGVFVIRKAVPEAKHRVQYKSRVLSDEGFSLRQADLEKDSWIFRDESISKVIERIASQTTQPLNKLTKGISEGIVTGQNAVFLLSVQQAKDLGLEKRVLQPCVRGREIRRYVLNPPQEVVIYPYELVDGKTKLIPETEMRQLSKTWAYLESQREKLKGRSYFDASSKTWYELWCQRNIQLLAVPKIVVAELADHNRFVITDESRFYGDTVCGIVLRPETQEKLSYFLGLLNSKLIEFYFKQTTVPKANGFYIYKTMFLKNIPIRTINFDNPTEKAQHDTMVQLVERMLELQTKRAKARTAQDAASLDRQIVATDRQIDQLVYQLYDLSAEEIALVEAK